MGPRSRLDYMEKEKTERDKNDILILFYRERLDNMYDVLLREYQEMYARSQREKKKQEEEGSRIVFENPLPERLLFNFNDLFVSQETQPSSLFSLVSFRSIKSAPKPGVCHIEL